MMNGIYLLSSCCALAVCTYICVWQLAVLLLLLLLLNMSLCYTTIPYQKFNDIGRWPSRYTHAAFCSRARLLDLFICIHIHLVTRSGSVYRNANFFVFRTLYSMQLNISIFVRSNWFFILLSWASTKAKNTKFCFALFSRVKIHRTVHLYLYCTYNQIECSFLDLFTSIFFRVPFTFEDPHYLCSSGKHKQLYIGFNISSKILLLFIWTYNFFSSFHKRELYQKSVFFFLLV